MGFMAGKKQKQRAKRRADNRFTALTGHKILRLEHPIDCWVTVATNMHGMTTKKVAFACFNNWQEYQINRNARRMKQLKVTQTCGNKYCVNPEHLLGEERPYNPLDAFRKES